MVVENILNKIMIKNILKGREESKTYLTYVCRHRKSRQIIMKMDETGAFSQFHPFPS